MLVEEDAFRKCDYDEHNQSAHRRWTDEEESADSIIYQPTKQITGGER